MKPKQNKSKPEENWQTIRIRTATLRRLRLIKAQMEVPVYDDVITAALNLLEEDLK